MTFSKFSVFSGSVRDSRAGKLQRGYSRLGDLGPSGGSSNDGSDPTFTAADDTPPMAAAADEPGGSTTHIWTDAESLRQAIEDTSQANGTPVFRSGPGMVGILDGHVTRTGENEWRLRNGTVGVLDGGRPYAQRYKGFDVFIRQDPQTGAISIEEK